MDNTLIRRAQKYTTPFAILKMYVSDALRAKYTDAIVNHNNKMEKNEFPDSGFDLILPMDFIITGPKCKIDFEVNCEMQTIHPLETEFSSSTQSSSIAEMRPTAFYLLPRSSISKKPLMMANSVGLIDSGYRGKLQAVFSYFPDENEEDTPYKLEKYERLVQIVHPTCCRIFVQLVNSVDVLTMSERNTGAFGSTGI